VILSVRHQGEVALETVDRHLVCVHLGGDGGAVADLEGIVFVEDEQPVARCRGARQIVSREIGRLQVRELAREDFSGGEGAQVMLAQFDPAAVDGVEQLLDLVIADPKLNEREALIRAAREILAAK